LAPCPPPPSPWRPVKRPGAAGERIYGLVLVAIAIMRDQEYADFT
jgi:hypothetical protein